MFFMVWCESLKLSLKKDFWHRIAEKYDEGYAAGVIVICNRIYESCSYRNKSGKRADGGIVLIKKY